MPILALLNDLFFTVKISDAARRAGVAVQFLKEPALLLAKAAEKPPLIVIDLNYSAADPVGLVARLKADPDLRSIPIVGYLSHVQAELRQKAEEAGCDTVLARSAFSDRVADILQQYAAR